MTEIAVTQVTPDTPDDLTEEDYRQIYDELAGYDAEKNEYALSTGDFCKLIKSELSRMVWWKYHQGKLGPSRKMRNELRRAVGQPALPPLIDADGEVEILRIGNDAVKRIIMLGREPVEISVAERVSATQREPVTLVTAKVRKRRKVDRPWVTEHQALQRELLGVDWRTVIDAGLSALNQVTLEKIETR